MPIKRGVSARKSYKAVHLPPLLTIKRIIVWDVELVEQQQVESQVVAKVMEVAAQVVVTG
jgi:hypothetical protein